MKAIVTGAAGFIGSHLSERLLQLGYEVWGIDCFTDYYSREIKKRNLSFLWGQDGFHFEQADLVDLPLKERLQGIDYVFHQAAQAGVRASWGDQFNIYTRNNILATQKLLEACRIMPVRKFIYASSSSVYGEAEKLPMKEEHLPRPISPYGVSKLAGEHLCGLYDYNYGVPVVSLRYFTVYGPRQRPDMGFHKFCRAILRGEEIEIYGDGRQTRDFTYISDAVEANIAAVENDNARGVFNIGGGSRVNLRSVLSLLENYCGRKAQVRYVETQKGDPRHTYADTSKAHGVLGYRPQVEMEEGLQAEVEYVKQLLDEGL